MDVVNFFRKLNQIETTIIDFTVLSYISPVRETDEIDALYLMHF